MGGDGRRRAGAGIGGGPLLFDAGASAGDAAAGSDGAKTAGGVGGEKGGWGCVERGVANYSSFRPGGIRPGNGGAEHHWILQGSGRGQAGWGGVERSAGG